MADRTCSVDGCERPLRANGFCKMHDARLKTTGTLDLTGECCICGIAIPYKGKGRRQTLCEADECRRAYNVRKTTEWGQRNPEKRREVKRRWAANNPVEHSRRVRAHLLREYGLTPEQYDEMLSAQGGACLLCGCVPDKKLHVDHCHVSGAVRGLLCSPCNLMLGLAKDDPSVLLRAAEYIHQHHS